MSSPRLASRAHSEKCVIVTDYNVGEQIGRGSFGQIRTAFHRRLRLALAVKVMAKQDLQVLKHGKSTMFNETILAALVDHPNIIEVVEVADSHAYIFQFMRLAEHGDLLRRLRTAPLEMSLAFRVIDQLLSAVEYLHSYGICHRDIKLENILLSRPTNVKLCDFGLATMTFDGLVKGGCGSFEYSAPEVIANPVCNGFKADMWSVGVAIYAIFARALPFLNVTREFDFANAVVDYSVIPPAFRPLIEQLLSVDPDARPHATEARGFHALNSSQTRRKDPLSAIPDVIDLTDSTELVSRLSQILRVSYGQLTELLRGDGPRIEKLVFVLAQKKLAVLNSNPLFRGAWRSLPSPVFADRTIQVPFADCSANVFKQLHAVLMRQRCCVSSPIVLEPVIVPMKEAPDVRISFSCVDEGESNQSVLTLVVHEDAGNLAQEILAQLRPAA
jgi:serine/threonine protein kinase